MVRVAELAEEWLDLRHGIAGRTSSNTARAQRRDLVRWGEAFRTSAGDPPDGVHWLDLDTAWGTLGVAALTAEAAHQALRVVASSYRPATVERMASTLRGFCGWLVETGRLDVDPSRASTFAVPRRDEVDDPHALTPGQVDALLAAAGKPPEPRVRSTWPARDVAIVEVLANTGVRASELVALQVGDVTIGDRRVLHVRRATKSRRRREVPLPSSTSAALEAWLTERSETLAGRPSKALFCTRAGEPLTRSRVDHLLRRLAKRAGIGSELPSDAMAHAFRHHFGVQLAMRGVPVPVLQLLLGHADPRTTSLYTRLTGDELTAALDDAGWL